MNWRSEPRVIIDTETCGTDPARHRVVEVAALRSDGARFSALVNPGCPIGEASAIHGITDEMVASAPAFDAIAVELAAFCEGHIVAAYNARFDRAMLIAEFLRTRLAPPAWLHAPMNWIDVLAWARRCRNRGERGAGRFKLGTVATRFGVEIGTAHRALGDCETTGRVLDVLAGEPGLMPARFDEMLARQAVHIAAHEEFMARLRLERLPLEEDAPTDEASHAAA